MKYLEIKIQNKNLSNGITKRINKKLFRNRLKL